MTTRDLLALGGESAPASPVLMPNLAYACVRAGDTDAAIRAFGEALRLDSNHTGAMCDLAMLLLSR